MGKERRKNVSAEDTTIDRKELVMVGRIADVQKIRILAKAGSRGRKQLSLKLDNAELSCGGADQWGEPQEEDEESQNLQAG